MGGDFVQISGDVVGIVSAYVETENRSSVLFINGAAGNLAPIYSVYSNPEEGHLNHFRALLGEKIIDANKKLSSLTDSVKWTTGSIIVERPSQCPDLVGRR
jgi:hypothetical protein